MTKKILRFHMSKVWIQMMRPSLQKMSDVQKLISKKEKKEKGRKKRLYVKTYYNLKCIGT